MGETKGLKNGKTDTKRERNLPRKIVEYALRSNVKIFKPLFAFSSEKLETADKKKLNALMNNAV